MQRLLQRGVSIQLLTNKRRKPDFVLILCVLILVACGLLAIYSATLSSTSEMLRDNFNRQIIWLGIGLVVAMVVAFLPMGIFKEGAYIIYALSLTALIIGAAADGMFTADRWVKIGGFTWQPSEFAKIGVILAVARYLGEHDRSANSAKTIFVSFAIVLAPFLLVAQQPDLGTALVFFVILIPMLYWAGLHLFIIFVMISPIIVFFAAFNLYTFSAAMILISIVLLLSKRGALVFWSVFIVNVTVGSLAPVFWSQLRPYQQKRVLTFLGLVSDPQGVGYQIIQSKVAIGSGGLLGKGFLHGTQTQLRFLPAQHTDFVISVLAEEFGFVLIVLLLVTFLVLLIRCLQAAVHAENKFNSLAAIGCLSVLTFQVFVNIGMATGIVPVAGLPLPFLSYGGSSMLMSMTLVALVINISSRR